MISEEKYKNKVKIFCIYFKNLDKQYEFGEFAGKAEIILEEISEIGGTEKKIYTASTLEGLYDSFTSISDAIKNNYSLEYTSVN